jgi:hypothetical protein
MSRTERMIFAILMMTTLVIYALSSRAFAQTDCYPIAPSGEGFPRVQCVDGSVWYQDMDGIDGALGTVGDGVWKEEAR